MKANKTNVNETSITTTIGNTTISAIDENILTIAKANLNGLNIPIGSDAYNKALQIQSLDVLNEKSAIERCRLAYELKKSCERLDSSKDKDKKLPTFKDLCNNAKRLTKSNSWDYSNMNKDSNAYIKVLQNDSISKYFEFASVTVLRAVQSCKNFSELIKAIENGLLTVPTVENGFKSSTVKEFTDVVKLINAGLVNITADNISHDGSTDDSTNDSTNDSTDNSTDDSTDDSTDELNGITLEQLINLYNSASDDIKKSFLEYLSK